MMRVVLNRGVMFHVVLPAVIPAAFFVLAAVPVEVMSCWNRGLTAVIIALAGGLAGVVAMVMGTMRKLRCDITANWWVLSALILIIPAISVIFMVIFP